MPPAHIVRAEEGSNWMTEVGRDHATIYYKGRVRMELPLSEMPDFNHMLRLVNHYIIERPPPPVMDAAEIVAAEIRKVLEARGEVLMPDVKAELEKMLQWYDNGERITPVL